MESSREEIAAELVWRYVERLREAEAEGRSAALTRAELEQLLGALETASRVPEALRCATLEDSQAEVRQKVHAALNRAPVVSPGPASPDREPTAPRPGLLPFPWTLPIATAAA